MSEQTFDSSGAGDGAVAAGAYEAPEGFEYEVYGEYADVEDLDGSMVTIERAYEAPRRQATLGVNERGNLVAV